MTFVVNGEEVAYLHIEQSLDGNITVAYSKQFNIVTTHMGEIMKRLRKNGLYNVLVFKDLKHRIISILFDDLNEMHGVLHCLEIPPMVYDVMVDDKTLIIDTVKYEKAIGVENPVTLNKDWVKYTN